MPEFFIYIRETFQNRLDSRFPGNPILWTTLIKKDSSIRESLINHQTGYIACYQGSAPNTEELLQLNLKYSYGNSHSVELLPATTATTILVRSLKSDPRWTELEKDKNFLWIAKCYLFSSNNETLKNALESMCNLGEKSELFNPDYDEYKIVSLGDLPTWPKPDVAISSPQKYDYVDLISEAFLNGEEPLFTRSFLVEEQKHREAKNIISFSNTLETFLWPKATSKEQNIFSFRTTERFDEHQHLPWESNTSFGWPTFVSTKNLILDSSKELFFFGNWKKDNLTQKNIYSYFLSKWSQNQKIQLFMIDGSKNPLAYFVETFVHKSKGWAPTEAGIRSLYESSLNKSRQNYYVFIYTSPLSFDIKDLIKGLSINLLSLGRSNETEKFSIQEKEKTIQEVPLSDLNIKRSVSFEKHDLTHPDPKFPIYGFERASLFPDQFLLKSVYTSANDKQRFLHQIESSCSPFSLMPCMKNKNTRGLIYFLSRDIDGDWGVSRGSCPEWLEVDPENAGYCAVDKAIRGLLATGSHLKNAQIKVFIDETLEYFPARYLLALKGISRAISDYSAHFTSVETVTREQGHERGVIVVARSPRDHTLSLVPAGFRMQGEIIYAVGPRPAFVDVGSKILNHVKVISNHTTPLVGTDQLEIYLSIQNLIRLGAITSIRLVSSGGITECLGEMSFWSGMGAQIKPNIPTIELFSSAPGRLIFGVLPQKVKTVETEIKNELLTLLGTVSGEKLMGATLKLLLEERNA